MVRDFPYQNGIFFLGLGIEANGSKCKTALRKRGPNQPPAGSQLDPLSQTSTRSGGICVPCQSPIKGLYTPPPLREGGSHTRSARTQSHMGSTGVPSTTRKTLAESLLAHRTCTNTRSSVTHITPDQPREFCYPDSSEWGWRSTGPESPAY